MPKSGHAEAVLQMYDRVNDDVGVAKKYLVTTERGAVTKNTQCDSTFTPIYTVDIPNINIFLHFINPVYVNTNSYDDTHRVSYISIYIYTGRNIFQF